MDGLSLLGLVCEKEKQLLKQEEVIHPSYEHQYSRTKNPAEDITDNRLDCDLDIYHNSVTEYEVKEEKVIKLDLDVVSKEPIGNISVKQDISEDADDSDGIQVMTSSDPKSTTYEKSSQAVATHLNINDFGQFIYKIQENQLCKYSRYTGWHLQRATGMMKIKLTFRNIKLKGPL